MDINEYIKIYMKSIDNDINLIFMLLVLLAFGLGVLNYQCCTSLETQDKKIKCLAGITCMQSLNSCFADEELDNIKQFMKKKYPDYKGIATQNREKSEREIRESDEASSSSKSKTSSKSVSKQSE